MASGVVQFTLHLGQALPQCLPGLLGLPEPLLELLCALFRIGGLSLVVEGGGRPRVGGRRLGLLLQARDLALFVAELHLELQDLPPQLPLALQLVAGALLASCLLAAFRPSGHQLGDVQFEHAVLELELFVLIFQRLDLDLEALFLLLRFCRQPAVVVNEAIDGLLVDLFGRVSVGLVAGEVLHDFRMQGHLLLKCIGLLLELLKSLVRAIGPRGGLVALDEQVAQLLLPRDAGRLQHLQFQLERLDGSLHRRRRNLRTIALAFERGFQLRDVVVLLDHESLVLARQPDLLHLEVEELVPVEHGLAHLAAVVVGALHRDPDIFVDRRQGIIEALA
mmetsp:Transcript_2572/g.10770  ORF Transcript_2572/g.10770 Transcript_2572/m.10770 type:complete len:335 (+) Transcript_2572:2507-3511(+)